MRNISGYQPISARLARIAAVAIAALGVLAIAATDASARNGSGGVATASSEPQERPAGNVREARYSRLWEKTSRRDRRWARSTAQCESGGDPDAIGGGGMYRGAFQFMRSTWANSPKSPGGDPIDYNYRTQAVVAIALMHRDGAGHWPVCG